MNSHGLAISWEIPISDPSKTLFKSQIICYLKNNYQIDIIYCQIAPRNILVQVSSVSEMIHSCDILMVLIFHHPDGPFLDFPLYLHGTFGNTRKSVKKEFNVTHNELKGKGYIVNDKLILSIRIMNLIDIKQPIPFLDQIPNPHTIYMNILKRHSYLFECTLTPIEIGWLTTAAGIIFLKQSPIIKLSTPIIIVGDLHGNIFDLIRIFRKFGYPRTTNYLFLGDYVDRGEDQVDTMCLLLLAKVLYPENVFLLRGNHETDDYNSKLSFYDECKKKNIPFEPFAKLFETLPFCAIVGQKIFCVHGGISPKLLDLEMIRTIQMPTKLPTFGVVTDMLWSDPDASIEYYGSSKRNAGFTYGSKAVNEFLERFGFELIVRSHETVPNGYEFPFPDQQTVVTVFSSSNAKDNNKAAVMVVDNELRYSFQIFEPLTEEEHKNFMENDLLP